RQRTWGRDVGREDETARRGERDGDDRVGRHERGRGGAVLFERAHSDLLFGLGTARSSPARHDAAGDRHHATMPPARLLTSENPRSIMASPARWDRTPEWQYTTTARRGSRSTRAEASSPVASGVRNDSGIAPAAC